MKLDFEELDDLLWFIAKWILIFSLVAGIVYYIISDMIN